MIQRAVQPASRRRVLDSEIGMKFVRRRLSWLLSVWLVCQVTALAAPVVLASTGSALEQLCTCAGGDHETCPMHHGKPDSQDPSRSGVSACRAPLHVALLWMAGGTGVLPHAICLDHPNVGERIPQLAVSPDDVVSPHSTPPPRLQ